MSDPVFCSAFHGGVWRESHHAAQGIANALVEQIGE